MRTLPFVLVPATLAALLAAQGQVIDFEDQPAGATINAQYSGRGVIFANAFLDADPHAHSGTRVLRSISPGVEAFQPAPLRMTFTGAMSRVAFFAGNLAGVTGAGTLKVFDASNALVGQDGPKAVPNNSFAAFFEVRVPQRRIVRAEFHIAGSAHVAIDDLVVEGTAAPVPTTTPVVAFTSPTEGAVLAEGMVPLRGTVTGASLLDPITLRVLRGLPSDSTAPPSENAVSLAGTGTTRTFSLEYHALIGPYTVTAIAKNTGNLQGTATVNFAVLPDAIRTRYDNSGGAGIFGSLRFGAQDGNCVMAVYQNGLIAAEGNQTYIVKGAIFTKWMATREPGAFISIVGCPTAEEREALAGARAQDFRLGRIYATATASAYVPAVFRDAIEHLGGEAATGIATTDPASSAGAMQTWLFQRFARLDLPGIEASTFEIRGAPPILYVERVGDGLDGAGLTPNGNSATVYRTFECKGNLGPCTVPKLEYDALLNEKCNGVYPAAPTEWQSLTGKYVPTPVVGWVHESKLSCEDNPHTHDHFMTNNSPRCLKPLFPSDWNVTIRPMAGFGSRTTTEQTYMEIEFEAYYAAYFFAGWGWPIPGDLVFTNGRWILDCAVAHGVKAEIHPPFGMAHSRMRKRADGSFETLTEIWVTGHYPGGQMDFDIWPPPRPSPNAFLTVTKPVDSAAAYGVTLALTTSFSGARVRFNAPFREVKIEETGKMEWMTGRGYEGEWTVRWSEK